MSKYLENLKALGTDSDKDAQFEYNAAQAALQLESSLLATQQEVASAKRALLKAKSEYPLQVDRIAGRIEGAKNAAPILEEFLTDLWAQTGITPAQTILAGFSQGAMMSLHVGTALEPELAGIVAFSGAFVPADGFAEGRFAKPPVTLIHGELDQVVDPDLSRQAATELSASGFEVSLHISANTAHGIAPDGLDFATSFLMARLG